MNIADGDLSTKLSGAFKINKQWLASKKYKTQHTNDNANYYDNY